MKKRILSILLLCCMVLTLLPTTAFAAGKIWVGTEEELLAALADNTIGKITLTADITVRQTLVIDRQVVLVLDHSLKIDREQSSSGTLFHITKSGYLDTNAGSITDNVLNEGKFFPRQISGEVINEGEIIRGSFSGKVKNRGSINYGSFRGEVENAPGGKIANGELYGEVTNHGEIAGWKFYGKVTNDTDGLITSGEFYGEVVNNGRISYGKFYGDVVNNGTITGGSFFGTLTGGEIQDNAYIAVTFDSDGGSTVAAQRILRGQKAQRPAAPTKDGYTFIGWYNKADLQYINLPEWNFDYPVFENMELVAQWMEARPISTDPITYLDKDGNQQVCTAYTVLTSETKESILNYDDKWYDLPAGWYVVEGGVTITPRLDTHGAVNLILTNGSHLTAEWGIDVKVGDTFTVYAQSTDEGTMGRLTACLPADFNLDRMVHYSVWPDSGMAGIGSSARWREGNDGIRESEGTIVINGGNIRAKGQDNASAIGGTRAEEIEFRSTDRGEVYNRRQGGSITINGGVVRTEPFALLEGNPLAVISVGIGTCQMGYGGSVTINGGTVIAEAANDAITTGDGGTITINGGDVTARGGVNNFGENSHRVLSGNGIGPLLNGSITINGGTVKATAEGHGFGIGGSRFEIIGTATVTINGGTIDATANHNNAAIGDRGKGKSGVTITDGVIHAAGKGSAAGIGSMGDIRITGGELTVSAEGSGAAIGGFTDKYSERVNCKSITINGDVIQSISSKDGACIGAAAGGSVGSIAISNAELSSLSAEKILIGWGADSPGGKLTIRNCRVESTDELTTRTDGIRVGSNSIIVTDGKATIGAGSEISKAAQGTKVTLTANAAPDGKEFDKWVVESGSTTLEDANSETTTFIMPDSEVSVKATYKNAPVTTYSLTTQVNGGHGTISASKTGLTAGSTETITFTPEVGYEIDTVTVNGTATSVSGNTLNVTMNENKTVIVTYKATGGGEHTHSYGSEWKNDADNHWHECSCGDKTDVAAHTASDWIIDTPATATTSGSKHKECTVCGYTMATETIPATGGGEHTHSYGSEWKNDADNHWHECSCGDKTDVAAHTASDWIIDTPATATTSGSKHKECTVCGYTMATETIPATGGGEHTHSYGSEWKNDADNHWHECSCGDKTDVAAHTASDWIIDTPATATTSGSKHKECTVCGYTMATETIPATGGSEHSHSYGSEWKNDATNHWHECSCGDKDDVAAHTASDWIIDTPATATADGTRHKECTVCKRVLETGTIPATGGGGGGYSYYTIKATAEAGGSISPSGNVSVREGRDQVFTFTPDKGYAISNVKIDGKSIGAVKSYTFENVRRTHTIEVIFMKANGNPQTGVFVDVATGSYYEDAVDWAVENGITQGTDDTHFSPDGICTRAQAVTFLWRTAGSPASKTSAMPFTDVPVGSYYYDAVLWAVENGITKGTSDTTFSPNMTCTRAQIVAFLWRSEKSPAAGTANPFADVKSTAYYADAVLWAVKENITKGTTNTTFSPDADCTRAQIVTFLWRCKK